MSLFRVFEISGSAMSAQTTRLNVTASNMANADSVSSSIDKTYRARHPVFDAVLNSESFINNGESVGVRVTGIVESQAPLQMQFRPDHPKANDEGNIFMPNVNIVEEMANMISASRSYQSNVEVVNASKQMMLRTLSLGQ